MPRDAAAQEASAPVWAALDAMSAQVKVKKRTFSPWLSGFLSWALGESARLAECRQITVDFRRRAMFRAALVFVVAAILAVRTHRRRADARSVTAEWVSSGIVVALGVLAEATH